MSTQDSIQELRKRLTDVLGSNGDWTQLFDTRYQLINGRADRLKGDVFPTRWSEETGAAERITPHDAAIPIVDDLQTVDLFYKAKVEPPAFFLAGERKDSQWPSIRPLRVGILTAGGNAPGLNTVVDSLTKRHHEHRKDNTSAAQVDVYGYVGGYLGLEGTEVSSQEGPVRNPDRTRVGLIPSRSMRQKTFALKVADMLVTDDFASEGCTRLKSRRGAKDDETVNRLAQAVVRDQLDILHVVGGDGSLRGARALAAAVRVEFTRVGKKGAPFSVVCVPKTMDNDIFYADPSFGFYTVVDEAVEFIRRMALEAETQDRVAVVQLFGAGSGFVALYAAYCSGEVDWVVLPETIPDVSAKAESGANPESYPARIGRYRDSMAAEIVKRLKQRDHAVVVLAEGATPTLMFPEEAERSLSDTMFAQGPEFRAKKDKALQEFVSWLKSAIAAAGLKHEVMDNFPKHLIRAVAPNGFDVALCKHLGKLAADNALAGYTDCAVSMWHGRPVLVPLELIVRERKLIQPNAYFAASMLRKLGWFGSGDDAPPIG